MSIKKNNSKKTGLIASTIIHLIVFILLTLPFMSLTYLDPPKQRTGGISLNLGESEDFSQSIVDDEEQKQSNNTNQKKTDSSNNNTNSENNKKSNKNTNGPKDHLVDNNSNNPSVDKSTYDQYFEKIEDRINEDRENKENNLPKKPDSNPKKNKSDGSSSGDIKFKNGQNRSAIDRPVPSSGDIKGVICVKIYVKSDGKVLQNTIDIYLAETTINDQDMYDKCINAAKKTTFEASTNTEEEIQEAYIFYNFDFKEK